VTAVAGRLAGHRTASISWPAARRDDAEGTVQGAIRILAVWIARAQQRRCLATLSDRSLKDLGITRCDVLREIRKPFWRG